MNILFLTNKFPTDSNHFTLEKELIYAFKNNSYNCTVANILEKKFNKPSHLEKIDQNLEVAHIRTGNLFNNVSFLEKKITVLTLDIIFPIVIKKLLAHKKFDLIIAYGPYLCGPSIIKPLKKYFNCKAVLMQWDIFPQNAYDLGIIKNKLLYKFFKHKQRQMLKNYELILCNSKGNIKYFEQNFPVETHGKLGLFYNCESPNLNNTSFNNNSDSNIKSEYNIIRQRYNIALDSTALIFGGNIGVPQELENIIKLAKSLKHNTKIKFIIIGQGTEAKKIKQLCSKQGNIEFFDFLPSRDYEKLLSVCDYGIISLSSKFTVPNFPAKITSYLKSGIPIFACVDNAAYDDLGQFLLEQQVGFRIKSEIFNINTDSYPKYIMEIEQKLSNKTENNKFRNNTKTVFEKLFNINNTFENIHHKIKELL